MKVLWFSHFVPFPPRGGARQRSYNLIRFLSRQYEVILVALNHLSESKERMAEYARHLKGFCAEVVICELPYPWKGWRWWVELATNPARSHPHECRAIWSQDAGRAWNEILQKCPDALIHYDSIDQAAYFPASEGFRRVLDHQNCESAMAERRAENETNPLKKALFHDQARKLLRLERYWCPRMDINLAVSDLDAARLQSRCPGAQFHVVENGTDPEYFAPSHVSAEPQTLVFAGDLSWYPNVSAILYFSREIWPLLKREMPDARLYLAGRNPSPDVLRCAKGNRNFVLVPDPEDIRPWVTRSAVFVCPIIDGGGTRLKILDALAMGMPVVTTSIGCEGLRINRGEHVLIADTPQDFAREIIRLLRDDSLRSTLARRARALVEEQYTWDIVGKQLIRAYERTRSSRKSAAVPEVSKRGAGEPHSAHGERGE